MEPEPGGLGSSSPQSKNSAGHCSESSPFPLCTVATLLVGGTRLISYFNHVDRSLLASHFLFVSIAPAALHSRTFFTKLCTILSSACLFSAIGYKLQGRAGALGIAKMSALYLSCNFIKYYMSSHP